MTTTIRDPEAIQRADRLGEIAKALRRQMRKEGIAAVKWSMSKMVRGWGDISQAGVTVRVGSDWEKTGYNRQQQRAAHQRGRDYRWAYPSVIRLEIGYSRRATEQTQAKVKAWHARVIEIAKEIEPSLVVDSDSTCLSLPGKES